MTKTLQTVLYITMCISSAKIAEASSTMCKKLPTCAELGYVMQADKCPAGVKYLTCPFDSSMVYCPEDCREYRLSAAECDTHKGSCEQCGTGDNWKYADCKQGWYLADYLCEENECNGFPISVDQCEEAKGTCTNNYCYAGSVAKTYYTSCNEGWTLNNSTKLCDANTCNGFNSTSATISGCRNNSSCKKGTQTVYTCAQCYTGYSLSNGTCSKTCDYTASGLPSHCKAAESCILGSASGETTYYASKCATCEDGYALSSEGLCVRAQYAEGDIYYYNDKAIGVVFFDDGNTTKIVALKDINANGQESSATNMYWSTSSSNGNYYYDVDTLTNYSSTSDAEKDMDGKSNTQKVLTYIASKGYTAQAATATSKYAPSVCSSGSFCGAGEWYLPALGELIAIYNKLSTIQTNLSAAGGTQISAYYYWSSTENSASYAWYLGFSSGYRDAYGKYYSWGYVRPVLAF